MVQAISSAIPNDLARYSRAGLNFDAELMSEANRLANVLQHFEATCQEGGYAMRVTHLADRVRTYAREAGFVDEWVGRIGIGFFISDSGREIIVWAERAVGFALVASIVRSGQYVNISLGWVKILGLTPSGVRTFLGITATRIRYENLLKYWDKAIGKAALILYIAIKWAQDFRDYTGTQLISALVVDAVLAVIITKIAALVGGLLLGALAGASLPAIVVGALAVGAVIAVAWLLDWVVEDLGIRDWAIGRVDRAINWTKDTVGKLPEMASSAAQTLDEKIFMPVVRKISSGIDSVTEFVDSTARGVQEIIVDILNRSEDFEGLQDEPGWSEVLEGGTEIIEEAKRAAIAYLVPQIDQLTYSGKYGEAGSYLCSATSLTMALQFFAGSDNAPLNLVADQMMDAGYLDKRGLLSGDYIEKYIGDHPEYGVKAKYVNSRFNEVELAGELNSNDGSLVVANVPGHYTLITGCRITEDGTYQFHINDPYRGHWKAGHQNEVLNNEWVDASDLERLWNGRHTVISQPSGLVLDV